MDSAQPAAEPTGQQHRSTPTPPPQEPEPTLLSLAEAAQAVSTTVQALWVRVQRGELQIHRVHEHGRTSTAVALKDILELYMDHTAGPAAAPGVTHAGPGFRTPTSEPGQASRTASGPGAAPVYEVPRPAAPEPPRADSHGATHGSGGAEPLRDELERERILRTQLEGKLESLRQVELASRRQAERLESRLEQTEQELAEAKRETLTLARALGQAEGQVLQLSGGKPKGDDPDAPRPRRRRRWWRRR